MTFKNTFSLSDLELVKPLCVGSHFISHFTFGSKRQTERGENALLPTSHASIHKSSAQA